MDSVEYHIISNDKDLVMFSNNEPVLKFIHYLLHSYYNGFVLQSPFCLLGVEAVLNVKSKNSKTGGKKGGSGIVGRKALNDITNKTSLHPEATSKKKSLPKEDVNVKEEMFLHDHKKCVEAQNAAMKIFNLEMVLPQDDSISIIEQIKVPHSPQCYPEPVELPMSDFSDWLDYSRQWSSPPPSPLPLSPLYAWQDEAVEFVLKEGIDA